MKSVTPHFGYQLQFISGEVEKVVKSKDDIRGFLSALYGGRTANGETGFDEKRGVLLDRIERLRRSKLKSEEVFPSYCSCSVGYMMDTDFDHWKELEYYATEFSRNGVHGPCMSPSISQMTFPTNNS